MKKVWGPQPYFGSQICFCFFLFVDNKGTTLTKIRHPFQSPPLLFAGVTLWKAEPTSNLQNATLSVFGDDFANFLHVFVSVGCGRLTAILKIFNQYFPMSESWKQLCYPNGIIMDSCFKYFTCFQCSFPEYKAKQETNVAAPSNQPLENCVSYPTCTRYSHTEGYGCKAHSNNSEAIALSGRKLY